MTTWLLMNHDLQPDQLAELTELGDDDIRKAPASILTLWAGIPPEADALDAPLEPVRSWLRASASPGDRLVVMGEMGATFQLVIDAWRLGVTPLHATTRREVAEVKGPSGDIRVQRRFRHVRFRKYPALSP